MKKYCFVLCIFVIFISCNDPSNQIISEHSQDKFVIAFGSCNKEHKEQPLWNVIEKHHPDLWVWLGDIIYADTEDMSVMKDKYQTQFYQKTYQQFRKKTPVIGTWDDHDYGVGDGGEEYPMKEQSQKLLLDFLEEPENSPRRSQKGVYASYAYGEGSQKIKIIVLDTRFHRQAPGKESDILGKEQWQWLENELTDSTAQIHIICSSIQIISKNHRYEKWANFPSARERLFQLFTKTKAPGIFILSGDRHFSEISKLDDESVPYPICEVTSSGLTHAANIPVNILRQENTEYRVSDCFNDLHFGLFIVDWKKQDVHLQICDKENNVRLQYITAFSSWKEARKK